ncbi:hypothetical protein [uncultured Tenacibaculum sp.]|uniref:hypothetical protein n=1 Tax=uncultured Tenacibaculum sp. TaxID=174713 RepID=UPI0026219E54|nr:hypothetical protein [uncultured Tenacibaculum sp.]
MCKIVLSVLLFVTSFCFGQESVTAEIKESKITSLIYTVDSLEELQSIDWDDVKEILEDTEEKVTLGFRVNNENSKENKLKFKHSFEIKSDVEDIDSSINIAKRIIKVLRKF